MKLPYRKKMASKITLYISFLLAIVLALVIWILFDVTSEIVENEAYDKVFYMTNATSNELNLRLENVVNVGESLENMIRDSFSHIDLVNDKENYIDNLLEQYIERVKIIAQEYSIDKTAYIYFTPELDGRAHDIYFVDDDNDGIATRQHQLPISYFSDEFSERGSNEWWFGPIEARRGYWTKPYNWVMDDGSTTFFVSYTRPVYVDNKLVAVVGTDFDYNESLKKIGELKVYDTGYAFLINDSNRVLVHPEYETSSHIDNLNDPIFEVLYDELDYSNNNIIHQADNSGVNFLVSYKKLDNNWVFGVVVPEFEIFETMDSLYLTILLMVALIVPILGIITFSIASHISRPIEEITGVVYRIIKGKYSLEVGEKALIRSDEVGLLARAIEDMRKGLLESFEKIVYQKEQIDKEVEGRLLYQEQFELVYKAFSKARDGMFVTDSLLNVLYANESMARITGFDQMRIVGSPLGKTLNLTKNNIWNQLISNGSWSGELNRTQKNGENIVLNFSISCIEEDGEENKYIGTLEDITDSIRQAEDIDYLKRFDTLTGLPNQSEFLEGIKSSIDNKDETHEIGVVGIINIDDFRLVNQAIGFEEANELIKEIGIRLGKSLRKGDLVSRLNGDEFGIFIQEMDHLNDIENSIEKIIKELNAPIKHESKELYMTVSIGVSIYPFDAEDENNLFAFANSALSHAKDQGKNNFQYYSREMTKDAFEKYELTNSLRQALEDEEFYLDYQPQYHLTERKIVGAEALLRWNHKTKGVISPIKFIPLAESSEFINTLGEWVIKKACLDIKRMHEKGLTDFSVAVNISSVQLLKPDFVIRLKAILDEINFDPFRLEIEITESIFMSSSHQVVENLSRIKNMGVRISIDDFGTGFSSLAYLKNFKVDKLKIDRSFVKDIPDNDDGNIAKLVINLAESLKIDVIAEGTETIEQVNFMLENNCKQIQGYYFSRPITFNELRKLVRRTNRKK